MSNMDHNKEAERSGKELYETNSILRICQMKSLPI